MSGKIHKVENMEEFARVSGISRPTVSKYFNDPGSVRQSTRERIETALDQRNSRWSMIWGSTIKCLSRMRTFANG